jgi:hypothetical protein
MECANADPPLHPDIVGKPLCGCRRTWAVGMRSLADPALWPRHAMTVALLKPGAPVVPIVRRLAADHVLLDARRRTLTTADTLRLHPEAYGEQYVAALAAHLTGGPVHVVLLSSRSPDTITGIPAAIRTDLDRDGLLTHLHMPGTPPDALADIALLLGRRSLRVFHERFDHCDASARLAFYRAVLGVRDSGVTGLIGGVPRTGEMG